jgi:hypothetical protein
LRQGGFQCSDSRIADDRLRATHECSPGATHMNLTYILIAAGAAFIITFIVIMMVKKKG